MLSSSLVMAVTVIPEDAIDRIETLKRQRGWSDRDLAERLGLLSAQTVRNWLNGRTRPSRLFWQKFVALEEQHRRDDEQPPRHLIAGPPGDFA